MRETGVRRSSAVEPFLGRVRKVQQAPADWAGMPRAAIVAMADAGREVLDCQRVLAKTGDNIVSEVLHGHGTFYEWTHYPEGDVHDSESHAQYYYHAHPKSERPGEHGHFHAFLCPKGMPRNVRPAPITGADPVQASDDALSHLIAIAMDDRGRAIELFTTNRWVTGETWYAASDVIVMLDRFAIDLARPSWPVNRWITALIRLFRPQIESLIRARDAAIVEWHRRHPSIDVFEDRRLEVTSRIEISVDDQMRHVSAALKRPRR